MQIDLSILKQHEPRQIPGYQYLAWRPHLLADHAEAKYQSFREELDTHVFPCLGNEEGCLKLMNEISCRKGFIPEATWLLISDGSPASGTESENCGTVQGIEESPRIGSIQNLGVIKKHRGKGLGKELLLRCLNGFQCRNFNAVNLEVTARNEGALLMYQHLGFQITNIVFKHIDLKYSS